MEIGIAGPKCQCVHGCEKGVEPMERCICRLPGTVVTARCDMEGGTTWHHNGSCISCGRKAEQERKERMAKRHTEIMAAPANPVEIEDARSEVEQPPVKRKVESPAANKPLPPCYITIHLPDRVIVIDDSLKVIGILAGLL